LRAETLLAHAAGSDVAPLLRHLRAMTFAVASMGRLGMSGPGEGKRHCAREEDSLFHKSASSLADLNDS
jgi:hypothetical protein